MESSYYNCWNPTKELINIIYKKLQNSLDNKSSDFNYKSSEFILKVVGCEEYTLYNENQLIINYEAVRKAVRNENTVVFQLLYFRNFKQIERECFNKHMKHLSKYKTKYLDSNLITKDIIIKHNNNNTLKYCPNSYGNGMKKIMKKILCKLNDVDAINKAEVMKVNDELKYGNINVNINYKSRNVLMKYSNNVINYM